MYHWENFSLEYRYIEFRKSSSFHGNLNMKKLISLVYVSIFHLRQDLYLTSSKGSGNGLYDGFFQFELIILLMR